MPLNVSLSHASRLPKNLRLCREEDFDKDELHATVQSSSD